MARGLPERGEILIDELRNYTRVGSRAALLTEEGYIVWIIAPSMTKETGDMILHEYLDELGYDGDIRKDV
jgi:hypothetical protein